MSDHQSPALQPDLAAWIGRESRRIDTITPRMADGFRSTLSPHLAALPGAPLGIHWCLAPDIVEPEDLGPDGHPRAGLFVPALPYTRRMWAGGDLTFHGTFAVGDVVAKTTTMTDLAFKTGNSGKLAFLTIHHAYHVENALVLSERQDVVYRDAAGTGSRPQAPRPSEPAGPPDRMVPLITDPTLLFRYSALTFNGHRIHYDQPYATEVEGYEGLVVHGPVQATLLLNLAAERKGTLPRRFSYRGQAPLICGVSARAEVRGLDGDLALRIVDESGRVTMSAQASAA